MKFLRPSKPSERSAGRLWEIDAARGVAILMMAVYHTAFDLYAYGDYDIDAVSGGWARFADLTAASFLLLVGVSLAVSASREVEPRFTTYLWRGLKVFLCGMLLTVVFLAFGMGYVVFGILHVIGVSVILAYPFLKLRPFVNIGVGFLVVALGLYVMRLNDAGFGPETPLLLPFGFVSDGLYMPDYRPLLPWFGVVLIGLGVGNLIYGGGGRLLRGDAPKAVSPITFMGRHSLVIYLVHQPVILAALYLFGVI